MLFETNPNNYNARQEYIRNAKFWDMKAERHRKLGQIEQAEIAERKAKECRQLALE